MRDGARHGLNGGYRYIFIYQLSAWPYIGIVALWRPLIPADIMGLDVLKASLAQSMISCEYGK